MSILGDTMIHVGDTTIQVGAIMSRSMHQTFQHIKLMSFVYELPLFES